MRQRLGILENPYSQRNKRGLSGLADCFRGEEDVLYRPLEDMSNLPFFLNEFAEAEISLLVIAGGDGTIQACLTEFLERSPFEDIPVMALIPRGMTNMTAADIGLWGPEHARLASLRDTLRAKPDPDRLKKRRVLRLDNAKDEGPQAGMFFGAAGITRAIHACREQVHSLHFKADTANGLTLAYLMLSWLLGGRQENAVVRGDQIAQKTDANENWQEANRLIVLATTLNKLVVGSRPFWGPDEGDFRFTSVTYPPMNLARSIGTLLYGHAQNRTLPAGYESQSVNQLSLKMDCPFTLDGQLFEPHPEKPLLLSAPLEARFLRF